jgi:Rps23 Pro-64 3,4-dihydroxylase Tpa1-like proline 4-hydroxylase
MMSRSADPGLSPLIQPIDRDALRACVRAAAPFPHFCIDNFLERAFAERVHDSFPSFQEARELGFTFNAVNEQKKVQITDSSKFAEPVGELNRALASPEFLDLLSYVFEIPGLLADEQLIGGGIHETGPRGHLDVHVDFNYIEERELHRRLNILVYFNKDWLPEWGGNIELWDKEVKICQQSMAPAFNRCVVFETSEISYHGVSAVRCPADRVRKSFAAYYYTREAPAHWAGQAHSTIFKARPNEVIKGSVLMPLERVKRNLRQAVHTLKTKLKG